MDNEVYSVRAGGDGIDRFVLPGRVCREPSSTSTSDDLWERGFRALIMDLDNTLLAWETDEIPAEAREWIEPGPGHGI